MPYENHDDEWREEENRRRADLQRERSRAAYISRDPIYPPEWAAKEFDEEEEKR